MNFDWQNRDGTLVIMNPNFENRPLVWINKEDGEYLVSIPSIYSPPKFNIKENIGFLSYSTLEEAKSGAEKEIKKRINSFKSPGV